jgi:hypothetical protein
MDKDAKFVVLTLIYTVFTLFLVLIWTNCGTKEKLCISHSGYPETPSQCIQALRANEED